MTKEMTYATYCRDRVTHEVVWINLMENSYKDFDGETIVEIPFVTIIENAVYDSDPKTQYVEIYDANDDCGNRLYSNEYEN